MAKQAKHKAKYIKTLKRWTVNVPPELSPTGRRQRKFFEDEKEAWEFADNQKERAEKFGKELSNLTRPRLHESSEVYRLCDAQNKPYSLLGIVRDYWEQQNEENPSISLVGLLEEYFEKKLKDRIGEDYQTQLTTLRNNVSKSEFAQYPVSDLRSSHLETLLREYSISTHNRVLRQLRTVFKYAFKKGYTKANPTDRLDYYKEPKRTVKTLRNREIEGLLNVALKQNIEMVPYFTIAAFAGIRVERELPALLWQDIHFDAKEILVRAEIAKTGHRRFPPISDNLAAWLRVYLQKVSVPFSGKTRVIKLTRVQIDKARRQIYSQVSPGKRWVKNGLRKSFASAMINSGVDRDTTCNALGHEGDSRKLYNFYHLAGSEVEAKAFWNILPPA